MNLRRGSLFIFLISRLCNYCFGIQEFQQLAGCCQKDLFLQGAQHPPFQENQHSVAGSGSVSHHFCYAAFPPRLSSLYVKIRIKVLSSKGDLKAIAE